MIYPLIYCSEKCISNYELSFILLYLKMIYYKESEFIDIFLKIYVLFGVFGIILLIAWLFYKFCLIYWLIMSGITLLCVVVTALYIILFLE